MNAFSKFTGAVALAACMTATSVAPANASLIINVNGVDEVIVPTNTVAVYNPVPFGVFNVAIIAALGQAILPTPDLLDVTTLISTSGAGVLTVVVTETDLAIGGAVALFQTDFDINISGATMTRSLYLDTTNSGLLTTLLYSTSSTSDVVLISALQGITRPFSLTERIVYTATRASFASTDDRTRTVPEPGSLALLALALLSLFGFAMTRSRVDA